DHRQPKRLGPVDGEQVRVRPTEEFVFFPLVNLADVLDERRVANQRGNRVLVVRLVDRVYLRRDHEPHPQVSCDLDGPVGPFLRVDTAQKHQIVATGRIEVEVREVYAVGHGSEPVGVWKRHTLRVANRNQVVLWKQLVNPLDLGQVQPPVGRRYRRDGSQSRERERKVIDVVVDDVELLRTLVYVAELKHGVGDRVPHLGIETQATRAAGL